MAGADEAPAIPLDPAHRDLLQEEIAALGTALRDPAARAAYQDLAAAVDAGEVPAPLDRHLSTVLELSLTTGRARRLHGAQHEATLRHLFFQTAAGAALRHQATEATRTLGALAGQRLQRLQVTAQAPGLFRLQLDTDRCQVTLELGSDGLAVSHLGVEI
jgi:hypothetical protein